MRPPASTPSIVSGALLCAVLAAGCDDGSSPLEGTWVRTKTVSSDTDVWTLALRGDGTFSMTHRHFENGVSMNTVYDSSREGEWWTDGEDRISLSGAWMDGVSGSVSLADVAAACRTFTQETMYVLDDSGTALFIGPDFDVDSAYTAGDSYDLLFEAGGNSYARESSLVMADASGAVVEQRDESYRFTFVDDERCTVEYSFTTTAPAATGEGVIPAESCSYEYSEGAEVVGLDGAPTTVTLLRFEYVLDGNSRTENFVMFDGVLISYTQSLLSGVLAGNAFVKVDD